MCGIAGMLVKNGTDINRVAVKMMRDSLAHRGPDGEGDFNSNNISLAHTRLSIIDLDTGAQPLFSMNRRQVLVANGEIYNYKILRAEFERDGYCFRTNSDCEVIIPLYKKYGDQCVSKLRGMFAFALWDEDENKILLARDRMGEKPLYYYRTDKYLIFASELRAIISSGMVPVKLDKQSIFDYFHYQYIPEPRTPIKNLRKLPAATTLSIDCSSWIGEEKKYWSMLDAEEIDDDPSKVIRMQFEDTITNVLSSDVPVGLSLSGGVDSSAIACIAAEIYPGKLSAISAGYKEKTIFDERVKAQSLANKLGINFIDVEISTEEMRSDFLRMIVSRDEPIADIAGYSYYRVMKAARENNVLVMLQGQGADELLWGYSWVKQSVGANEEYFKTALSIANKYKSVRDKINALKSYFTKIAFNRNYLAFYDFTPYFEWMMVNKVNFFTEGFLNSVSGDSRRHFEKTKKNHRMDLEITKLISDLYLQGNGIAQCDKLSMAHGVESRLPFLDHLLVEKIIGLRKSSRDDKLLPKIRLIDAIRDIVPQEVLTRPKYGFSPPQDYWIPRLHEDHSPALRDGMLVNLGILDPEMANNFSDPSYTLGVQSTITRMTIILELWLQSVMPGATFD